MAERLGGGEKRYVDPVDLLHDAMMTHWPGDRSGQFPERAGDPDPYARLDAALAYVERVVDPTPNLFPEFGPPQP